jgi:hypothetical protein
MYYTSSRSDLECIGEPGVVAYACNPSAQVAEAEEW